MGTIKLTHYKDPPKVEVKEVANLFESGIKGYNRMNGVVCAVDGLSQTVRANSGGHNEVKIAEPRFRVRKLTPKECWRLMGFSDDDFNKAKAALNKTFYNGADRSNSQLYKQAGNSIVVNVLMAIKKQMIRRKYDT